MEKYEKVKLAATRKRVHKSTTSSSFLGFLGGDGVVSAIVDILVPICLFNNVTAPGIHSCTMTYVPFSSATLSI